MPDLSVGPLQGPVKPSRVDDRVSQKARPLKKVTGCCETEALAVVHIETAVDHDKAVVMAEYEWRPDLAALVFIVRMRLYGDAVHRPTGEIRGCCVKQMVKLSRPVGKTFGRSHVSEDMEEPFVPDNGEIGGCHLGRRKSVLQVIAWWMTVSLMFVCPLDNRLVGIEESALLWRNWVLMGDVSLPYFVKIAHRKPDLSLPCFKVSVD